MPELPEVETIVQGLAAQIVGKTIKQLEVREPKMVWIDDIRATGDTEVQQAQQLVDTKTILTITRRGKMIIIQLSGDTVLLLHLKMTGQLIYIDQHQHRLSGGHPSADMVGELPAKSTHVIFHFTDQTTLYFNDQRKFGYLKVIPAAALAQHPAYAAYGPEPLESELTLDYLWAKAQRRPNAAIKQFILDQSVIAGIGNIYADESLFESHIYPETPVKYINQAKMEELIQDIKKILNKGLEFGGTSSQHYVQANGQRGTMQDHLMVYRRAGEPCYICATPIERIVVGGRGTHFCPHCQPITYKEASSDKLDQQSQSA